MLLCDCNVNFTWTGSMLWHIRISQKDGKKIKYLKFSQHVRPAIFTFRLKMYIWARPLILVSFICSQYLLFVLLMFSPQIALCIMFMFCFLLIIKSDMLVYFKEERRDQCDGYESSADRLWKGGLRLYMSKYGFLICWLPWLVPCLTGSYNLICSRHFLLGRKNHNDWRISYESACSWSNMTSPTLYWKASDFPVPSRYVAIQTLPGWK
jgi:hypothetical protein